MINALAFFGNGADVRSAFNAPRAPRARARDRRTSPHRRRKKSLDPPRENQNEDVNERYHLYYVHLHRE